MPSQNKTYTETTLWKKFQQNAPEQSSDIGKLMTNVASLLSRIQDTFPTYTLHDEQHGCNVINRMCDLLGDDIDKLSSLEMAILLLSAYFHDIGMVFTPEERQTIIERSDYQTFLHKHPRARMRIVEHQGEIPDDVIEWFCRWSHPKRANEYVCKKNIMWGSVDIAQAVGLVCQSHGQDVGKLKDEAFETKYLGDADLRFCAILLRLADILDFDNTRTPEEIYKYLGLSERNRPDSNHEWRKHFVSDGFRFPKANSRQDNYELTFIAGPDHPAIEYDIREFLDVIDLEIAQCRKMLEFCQLRWQSFKLPAPINRKDIRSRGYRFGEYRFTLEQDQILNLLMGENLYDDPYVFVRELAQNAIDTSRHRQFYEQANGNPNFTSAPINFTTWTDRDGYVWVRIDDYGMGMDEDIIRNYFLRVGRSYYQSDQFQVDKLKYQQFTPISRFGIGVLSCFIAGDILEVSTRRLDGVLNPDNAIRLSMSGLKSFYVVKMESEKTHHPDPMPHAKQKSEGYRGVGQYGTSIAVRLKSSQYHDKDWLKHTLEKYIFASPIPILLNGEPLWFANENIIETPLVEEWEYEFNKIEIYRMEFQLGIKFTTIPQLQIIPINLLDYSPFPKLLRGQAILAILKLHPTDMKKIKNEWRSEPIRIGIDSVEGVLSVFVGDSMRLFGRSEILLQRYEDELKSIEKSMQKIEQEIQNLHDSSQTKKYLENLFRLRDRAEDAEKLVDDINKRGVKFNYPIVINKIDTLANTAQTIRLSHNGINIPLMEENMDEGLIELSVSPYFHSFNAVISLFDDFRPDVSLSRDILRGLDWNIYSTLALTLMRALYVHFTKDEIYPYLFQWIENTKEFLFGEIRQDSLIEEWAKLPIIYTLKYGYLTCLEIQEMVKDGELVEIDIAGYDEILYTCICALIQAYLSPLLLKQVLVVTKSPYITQDGHDLFPPLFFVPYDEPNILGIIPIDKYPRTHYPINERHPFSQWLLANAIELQETVPGLFDLFYSGLLDKSESAINNGMQRLIEINHKTVPEEKIIITKADWGKEEK